MNMVSAGANLTEAQRSFCKHVAGYGLCVDNEFEAEASKLYRDDVLFRIVNGLRNYSQHGQLVVSVYTGADGLPRACFDAHQLLEPRLFSPKAWQRELLANFVDQVKETAALPARLSFAFAIDVYNHHVQHLHALFLGAVRPIVEEQACTVEDLLGKSPDKVLEMPDGTPYALVKDGTELHIINGAPRQFLADYDVRSEDADRAWKESKKVMEDTVGRYSYTAPAS